MASISNLDIATFRRVLKSFGWVYESTNGGHEKWKKSGALRPIIFQTHIDPMPIKVLMNNIRTMGISKGEFVEKLKFTR